MKAVFSLIRRTLNTVISPMVYIMMTVSAIVGFFFVFLKGTADVKHTLLYQYGTVIDVNLWGAAVLVAGLACLYGFYTRHDSLVKAGAMVGFTAWLFACIMYVGHGFWYSFLVWGLFHTLFQGYVYLSTSMGYLRRSAE